jgi:hypothetical membrane protein
MDRRYAWGGVLGPTGFVVAWAVNGAVAAEYSPVDDAISELAALGASARLGMTAGFVAFSVGVAFYARLLRELLPGAAWLTLLLSAIATLGVALFPLGSPWLDVVHGCFAAAGYITLAATPLLAARPFAQAGRSGWTAVSVLVGAVAAVCLVATLGGTWHGLLQRTGLGVGDVWIVATAIQVLRNGDLLGVQVSPDQP